MSLVRVQQGEPTESTPIGVLFSLAPPPVPERSTLRAKGAYRGELCDRVANSRRKAFALSLVAWFDVQQLGSFVLPFSPFRTQTHRHPRAIDGADRREALTANFSVSLAKCGVLNTARKICQIDACVNFVNLRVLLPSSFELEA